MNDELRTDVSSRLIRDTTNASDLMAPSPVSLREDATVHEPVAATPRNADRILIFGSGTGESITRGHSLASKHNQSDVAKHIGGSIVIDGHHLTENRLPAKW